MSSLFLSKQGVRWKGVDLRRLCERNRCELEASDLDCVDAESREWKALDVLQRAHGSFAQEIAGKGTANRHVK